MRNIDKPDLTFESGPRSIFRNPIENPPMEGNLNAVVPERRIFAKVDHDVIDISSRSKRSFGKKQSFGKERVVLTAFVTMPLTGLVFVGAMILYGAFEAVLFGGMTLVVLPLISFATKSFPRIL